MRNKAAYLLYCVILEKLYETTDESNVSDLCFYSL